MIKKIIGFIVVLAMCLPMFPVGLFAATSFAGGNGTESNPYQISNATQLRALATDVYGGTNYSGTYFKLTADINLNGSSSNQWVKNESGSLRPFAGTFDGNGHVISGLYIEETADNTPCGLFNRVSGTVKNLGVSGEVKGNKNTGGIVGVNEGTITNCYFTGTVSGTGNYTGGIAGINNAGGIIENCFNIGTVNGAGSSGGIVGSSYGAGNGACTIQSCYNAGNVSGTNSVGGIAGQNYRLDTGTCTVTNCYNTGTVSGTSSVGGVVGSNSRNAGGCNVINCYNTGSVSGTSDTGSVVGKNAIACKIENCYFKSGSLAGVGTNSNTNSGSVSVTGLTDSNFATQSKFSDWDFSSVWTMSDWAKRPVLRNNCFTVSFDSNGGTNVTNTYYVDYNSKYGTLPTNPSRTGYTFNGWYTLATGGSSVSSNSGSITSSHTLYAQWTPISYSITYQLDGGTNNSSNPATYTIENAVTLQAPTKTGYTFDGWYTSSNFSSSTKVTGITKGSTGAKTFYAKWTANTYTITYNKGTYGSGSVASGTKTHNVDFTLSSNKFTRTGYTQTGWSTSDGGTKTYNLGATYTANAAITLYPYWTANTYTVTLNYQDGRDNGSITVTHDGKYSTLPTPTRAGYEFKGWYTAKSGGTQVTTNTTVTTSAENQTLYARWRELFGVDPDTGEIFVNTTYGEAATVDLSELLDKYIKYAGGASSSENFTYSIKSGTNSIGASISSNTLTIPGTVAYGEYTLTIIATEISERIATFSINYGSDPVELTVTVRVAKAGNTNIPSVSIDYENEKLTGTTSDMEYYDPQSGEWKPCTEDMPLSDIWDGEAVTVSIRYAEADNHDASESQRLDIPNRPGVPDVDIEVTKSEDSITVTSPDNTDGEYEFSIDGENWSDSGEFDGLTPGTEHTVYVRTKAKNNEFASEAETKDVTTVDSSGDTDLLPGETVVTEGGTVTNKDGTVTRKDGGDVTTVSPIPNEGTKVDKDGNVTVPEGSKVNQPDCPEMTLPNGGVVGSDGSVTVPENGSVQIGSTVDIVPPAGEAVKPNDDRSVVVPDGSLVTPPHGPQVKIGDNNDETIVDVDGNITFPNGGDAEIGGSSINVPNGGTLEPQTDGTVYVPEGTKVTGNDGYGSTAPEGGAIFDPETGRLKVIRTVKFDSRGGSEVEDKTVADGEQAERPNDPTKKGYTFAGWYTDADCTEEYDFSKPVTSDIELFAKWTANSYTITFEYEDENGEPVTEEKEFTYGEATYGELLPELSDKPGYIFEGWCDENGDTVDSGALIDGDHTIRPVWTKCDHTGENWSDWTSDDDKTHSHTSEKCKETVTAEHVWKGTVTKEATETEEGEMTYTCDGCGATKTEEIDKIPATPGGDNTGGDNTGGDNTGGDNTGGDNTGGDNTGGDNTGGDNTGGGNTGGDNTGGDNTGGNSAGKITVDSESGENAPEVKISEETSAKLKEEVIAKHLTPEEKAAVANGDTLDIILVVEDAGENVLAEDKQVTEAVLTNTEYNIGMYLNIDMIKLINGQQVGKITEISSPIHVTIEIPEELRSANRAFVIVRVHNGIAEILEDVDDDPDTITIVTDKFSTYSIAYQDIEVSNSDNPNTGVATPIAITGLACAVIVTAVVVKRKKIIE